MASSTHTRDAVTVRLAREGSPMVDIVLYSDASLDDLEKFVAALDAFGEWWLDE